MVLRGRKETLGGDGLVNGLDGSEWLHGCLLIPRLIKMCKYVQLSVCQSYLNKMVFKKYISDNTIQCERFTTFSLCG